MAKRKKSTPEDDDISPELQAEEANRLKALWDKDPPMSQANIGHHSSQRTVDRERKREPGRASSRDADPSSPASAV